MIRSFRDSATEELFRKGRHRDFANMASAALRKLDLLDAAKHLTDLRKPPGNSLEALAGDRAGQHSIRINKQFRLCFEWRGDGPYAVEIVDYH